MGLVTLANNHVCDHGAEGLEETCQRLDKAGIDHVGAGKNLGQATQPGIVEIQGIRLGFLGYAWSETQATVATENGHGCAPLEGQLILSQIRELKTLVDHVIVMPHWGYCDYAYPTDFNVELGEKMLDAGASAVVGHHSHILHGHRKRNDGKLIAYSLGNFFFDEFKYAGKMVKSCGESAKGAVLKIELGTSELLDVQWHFTQQKDSRIEIDVRPFRKKEFAKRSEAVANLENYSAFWQKQVKKRMARRVLFWLNPFNWRKFKFATIRALGIMLKESVFRRKGDC